MTLVILLCLLHFYFSGASGDLPAGRQGIVRQNLLRKIKAGKNSHGLWARRESPQSITLRVSYGVKTHTRFCLPRTFREAE